MKELRMSGKALVADNQTFLYNLFLSGGMPKYSIVRFGDSVNNVITGPSVANWDLLTKQAELGILGDVHFITYVQKGNSKKYPKGLKIHEVSLEQSKEVSSRMPLQPHFKTVEKALEILPKLKNKIVAVAVSGRYSPQAYQFVNLINKNTKKKAYLVVEGHGSDVCGYQLREFEDLYKSIYKAADLLMLVETPIAKKYFEKEGFPTKNMVVIPTTILWENEVANLKKKPVIKEVRKKYEKLFGIPKDADMILTIGRFQPEKGHRFVVKAAKQVLKKHPDTYFVFGGSGEGTIKELKALIGSSKKIKLIGKIPFSDFYPLIASSTAFVVPSIEVWKGKRLFFAETGPRTVVEAMATANVGNTVVISSDSGGTPWKFNLDDWLNASLKINSKAPKSPNYKKVKGSSNLRIAKNRALLFKQADSKAIADAVCLVLEDEKLRKTIRKNSTKYVDKWYSSATIARTYKKTIEKELRL